MIQLLRCPVSFLFNGPPLWFWSLEALWSLLDQSLCSFECLFWIVVHWLEGHLKSGRSAPLGLLSFLSYFEPFEHGQSLFFLLDLTPSYEAKLEEVPMYLYSTKEDMKFFVEGQSGQMPYYLEISHPLAVGRVSKFNEISEFSVKFHTWSSSSSGCGGALIRF